MQYSAAPEGVWINRLGILADIQPKLSTSSKNEIRIFRRLGLGIFLQNLVQFQQISKGWLERIFLQTLRGSPASDYYKNRGYIQAPSNDIESISTIHTNPFLGHHIHFVSDKKQDEENLAPDERLVLFYCDGFVVTTVLNDKHFYFFLDGIQQSIVPTDNSELMFNFPFNTTGKELEGFLNDGDLKLWYDPADFCGDKDYVVPDSGTKRPRNCSAVRELNQHKRNYESSNPNFGEYTLLKDDPTEWLHNQVIAFWGQWMLRNPDSMEVQDVAILPPTLAVHDSRMDTRMLLQLFTIQEISSYMIKTDSIACAQQW